jgi:hypothetical protein
MAEEARKANCTLIVKINLAFLKFMELVEGIAESIFIYGLRLNRKKGAASVVNKIPLNSRSIIIRISQCRMYLPIS